jgi:hypothetical protein
MAPDRRLWVARARWSAVRQAEGRAEPGQKDAAGNHLGCECRVVGSEHQHVESPAAEDGEPPHERDDRRLRGVAVE